MLTIRLTRIGKKNQPKYRLVLTDHNFPVKGKFIEILGSFDPRNEKFEIKKERVEYWLKHGSKVSQTAMELLKKQKIVGKMDVLNRKDRAQTTKKGAASAPQGAPAAREEAKKPEAVKTASTPAPAVKPEEKKEETKPVEQKESPKTEVKKETPKPEVKPENKPKAEAPKASEQAK